MKIWQVWDDFDAAQSDSFFARKRDMLAHVKRTYRVRGPGKITEPGRREWYDKGDPKNGEASCYIHAREIVLKPTCEDVADALKRYPMR